jgi:hypothetical protein
MLFKDKPSYPANLAFRYNRADFFLITACSILLIFTIRHDLADLSLKTDLNSREVTPTRDNYGFEADPYESVFFKPLVLDREREVVITKFKETHAILDWRNEQHKNGNLP